MRSAASLTLTCQFHKVVDGKALMTSPIRRTQTVFSTALLLVACAAGALTQSSLAATPACDPNNGGITVPAGFCAFIAADNLGTARHLAVAANGDLYVALQNGGVMALRDTDGDGRFEMQEKFGSTSVTGIA